MYCTERKSGSGYTGFTCYAAPDVTLEDDLLRRDLTINALAQDEHGQIIDAYGGQDDLRNRLLRHVSPAFSGRSAPRAARGAFCRSLKIREIVYRDKYSREYCLAFRPDILTVTSSAEHFPFFHPLSASSSQRTYR